MYSLRLVCRPREVDSVVAELWEAGTAGIRELPDGENTILIAGFENELAMESLNAQLDAYEPRWQQEETIDWTRATQDAWPARAVGDRIFLAPVWNNEATPTGRVRVIHNPGMASGTGEHPCTQLALMALENLVTAGCVVADIGTGSGILSVAALCLGAGIAVALDTDETALTTARENSRLNGVNVALVAGSVECLRPGFANVVVANLSGSVLIAIADKLLENVKQQGSLVLTGFPESELAAIHQLFGDGEVTAINEWRCLSLRVS